MDQFVPAPLSSALRPVLIENEVEIKSENFVSVVLQNKKVVCGSLFPTGLIILTNIRLITIPQCNASARQVGWGISLESVELAEDCAKSFGRSTRIRICLKGSIDIGLRFEREGKDSFLSLITKTLERKSWLTVQPSAQKVAPEPAVFSASDAGVSGIIRRQERSIQSVDNITKAAVSDLDALMARAKETIAVIQRCAAYARDEASAAAATASETGEGVREVDEMEGILQSIGMVSPVTRFSAGRMYHEQLAKQTADVLLAERRLQRLGGMITLTDLYCLLNRARGAVLLSPEDLLESAELMHSLSLGLRLRVFPSGVKALQLETQSDEQFAAKILQLFSSERGSEYTASGLLSSDLSRELKVSIAIAQELLLTAESSQVLCRDESVNGVGYFPNLMRQYEEGIAKI